MVTSRVSVGEERDRRRRAVGRGQRDSYLPVGLVLGLAIALALFLIVIEIAGEYIANTHDKVLSH